MTFRLAYDCSQPPLVLALPFDPTTPRGLPWSRLADLVHKLLYAALGLVFAGAAGAQPLGLEEALRAAVVEHPSVAARRSDRQAAEMKLEVAERQRFPGLVAQTGRDASGAPNTTLRITQALWTGGRITGEIDLASATVNQAHANIVQAQLDIMVRVATSFTEIGRVQARQLAAASNLNEHIRLTEMIRRKVDSEVSPMSDQTQAMARLSQAKADLNVLQALASKARSSLNQSTGKIATEIVRPESRMFDANDLDRLVTAALAYSPVLQRLEYEYEATTADMAVRRSAAFPQVQMRVDHNRIGSVSNTRMYVALDVQTGAGFSVMASVREAQARRDAIQSQIEMVRRETMDAIAGDWADLQSHLQQSANLTARVASTTAVYDSFVRQYSVGRKGWNDVLNAQLEVVQARFQLADAEWGAILSALRLQMFTGELTPDDVMHSPATQTGRLVVVSTQPVPSAVLVEPKPLDPSPSSVSEAVKGHRSTPEAPVRKGQ